MAKEPLHIKAMEAPIISHGAGTWLTGEKATKFLVSNPDRGIPCKFNSDEASCVFVEELVLLNQPDVPQVSMMFSKYPEIMFYKYPQLSHR